ncbi:MAG: hypothetical protein R3F19_12845 [Verrucomicrobiales bacterium]
MSDQLLSTAEIPETLWAPDIPLGDKVPKGALSLPTILSTAYVDTLAEMGLLEQAEDIENRQSGRIGGIDPKESRDYFAENFSGSCGRTQLFCLDPHFTFKTTRDALVSIFSGGKLTILDIPSGAGAGTATLLSLVAQLRSEGVLPRVDLQINVVGGEISPTSRSIAADVFQKLQVGWRDCGMDVQFQFEDWDVKSDESTGDLVEKWEATFEGRTGLLLGNNFSGFLGRPIVKGNPKRWIDEVNGQIRMILIKVSSKGFSTFWLEPATKIAKEQFFPRMDAVFDRYQRIAPVFKGHPQSFAELRDPVVEDAHFAVRSTGAHLEPTHHR